MIRRCQLFIFLVAALFPLPLLSAETVDLSSATIVIRAGELPAAEKIASTILTEEIARRTGINWKVATEWPAKSATVIAISTETNPPAWKDKAGAKSIVANQAEAFAIQTLPAVNAQPTVIQITGHDPRGALYGVGKLLRSVSWSKGRVTLPADFHANETPDRPIRGHQIGYRDTANSWDAWTYDQFDQYFRDLVIFGANCVENIPWQDVKDNPLKKYSHDDMNRKFAELCAKYDLDHWVWVPVLVQLPKADEEEKFLKQQDELYRDVKRLDAIFVPGGDPGNNKANVLIPYLEKMAVVANKYHPKCKIWLSLQHFKADDIDFLYQYLDQNQPKWFGGLVMGPGSPPMESTRRRLAKQYQLRWYPDITHCVRSQYPVPWLDPAIGMTLGREPVNPRPIDYTEIYRTDYAFTDGFLTYSDGIHDDFNKNLWTQLGWNPHQSPRQIARDYSRFFFGSETVEEGADGLFALESDTRGPLAENGAVAATYLLFRDLEKKNPNPGSDWRLGMHVFRADYMYHLRNRLVYEQGLEQQALKKLAEANSKNIVDTLKAARDILEKAVTAPSDPQLLAKLNERGESLFKQVGLQTSVPKYHAANSQRGAVLDFLDYPLNNRWWLEDQFDKILAMKDSKEQLDRIDVVRNWENPGEQGYYDVLGHVGRSPRIIKLLLGGDAMRHEQDIPMPTQRWLREDKNNLRQAWHIYMDDFPAGILYNDLDKSAKYVVKLFSQKDSPLMIDGKKAKLLKKGETYDRVTEQIFEVPAEASGDGRIHLTWEKLDEAHLNWRERHYVTDIWVMKAK